MNRPDPKRLEQWVALAISLIVLDAMTGRKAAQLVARYKIWAAQTWKPKPADLPPAVVSALHTEARKITRDAAGGTQ